METDGTPDTATEPDRRRPRGFMALAQAIEAEPVHGEVIFLRASEVASVAQYRVHAGTRYACEGSTVTLRNGTRANVHESCGDVATMMNEEGEGRPPLTPPEPKTESTLLGLPSVSVDPGCVHSLTARPQLVARIRSILVDYATAEAFSMVGLRLGKMEVGAIGSEPVPLSMMGVAVDGWPRAMEIGGDQEGGLDLWKGGRSFITAHIMQDVTVIVENTSTRPVLFRGVLRVDVLREDQHGGD